VGRKNARTAQDDLWGTDKWFAGLWSLCDRLVVPSGEQAELTEDGKSTALLLFALGAT